MGADCLHVIDFEGHPRYGVVEYGVVTLTAAGIRDCQTRLCAPVGDIPPADSRIHGITTQQTMGRAPFDAEYEGFVALRRTGLFCAHNAIVESNLLRATWACPPFCPDWAREGEAIADWGPWLDTLKLSRDLFPEKECHALGELSYDGVLAQRVKVVAAEHCPPDRARPHAALYDAIATALWLYEVVGWQTALDWFAARAAPQAQAELF